MLKKAKRRYLALAIDSADKCDSRQLLDTIWNAVSRLFGEHGASGVNLSMIDFSSEEQSAIIRVNLEKLQTVRASLASITRIGSKASAVHVLMISGTLKALRQKMAHK